MKAKDRDSLCDMVLAARAALRFKGTDCAAEFLQDEKSQSAVLHQLLILGETVKHLSQEVQDAHPEIPWRDIARMRNKLIHHYEGISHRRIWDMLQEDLPRLLGQLEPLVPLLPDVPPNSVP